MIYCWWKDALISILAASDRLGISIEAEIKPELAVLENDRENIVEATIAPRSSIVGRSLRDIYFRDRYGISALAIWRQGEVITQRLRDEKLRFGDTLLLQGPRSRLEALQEGYDFLVLEPVKAARRKRGRIPLAIGIVGTGTGAGGGWRFSRLNSHGHWWCINGADRYLKHG
jgi:hypothetical protein